MSAKFWLSKTMDYDRRPFLRGWTNICCRLARLSGWRLRQDLEQAADNAHRDFGAFAAHFERKDWPNAIVCLEDGIKEAKKVHQLLIEHAKKL